MADPLIIPEPNANPDLKYRTIRDLKSVLLNQTAPAYPDFPQDFAWALAAAQGNNGNNQRAIDYINSWFEPSQGELIELGIPAARRYSMLKCTDSGLLLAALTLP